MTSISAFELSDLECGSSTNPGRSSFTTNHRAAARQVMSGTLSTSSIDGRIPFCKGTRTYTQPSLGWIPHALCVQIMRKGCGSAGATAWPNRHDPSHPQDVLSSDGSSQPNDSGSEQ